MSKKKAATKKGAPEDDTDYNENLRQNYKRAVGALGLSPHPGLLKAMTPEDDPSAPILEVYVDSELGSAGLRAFAAALLAKGAGMKPTPYKHLKTLRLWKTAAGDSGVAAVAEVLRNGKEEIALQSLEFMAAGVSPGGCAALSDSLMLGANTSLQILRMDMNPEMGDEGVRELCKGLRTNRTLTKLTLSYCNLGPAAAEYLAAVIGSPLSALEHLDVMGNNLGADGLAILARAAQRSKSLKQLVLRDNGIGGGTVISYIAANSHSKAGLTSGAPAPSIGTLVSAGAGASDPLESMATVDIALSEAASSATAVTKIALDELGKAIAAVAVPLNYVNLELNSITAEEASVLVPYMRENTKMQVFTVDTTLPPEIFAVLSRSAVAAKKKKVVKKKKK